MPVLRSTTHRGPLAGLLLVLGSALGCDCVGHVLPAAGRDAGSALDSGGADAGATDSGGQDAGVLDAGPQCTYLVSSDAGPPGAIWESAGPPGGYVSSVLALGQGVVLAGTGFTRGFEQFELSGGAIYRSVDWGKTFVRVQSFAGTTAAALVSIPGTNRVYAGVGSLSGSPDDGVWVSNDRGLTFAQVDGGLISPARVRGLSVAAGAAERVYAMVEGNVANPLSATASLYRRDDAGTWALTAMAGVNPNPGGPALALAADVKDPNVVYLADGANFYVSANAGDTFAPSSLFAGGALQEVSGLFTDPGNPRHLLLTTLNNGLYESTSLDAGFVQSALSSVGTTAALVSAGRVFVGTESQGLQVGVGGTFSLASACPPMPAVRAIAVAPDDAGSVFIGTVGGGVLTSDDGARTFNPQRAGVTEMLGEMAVTGTASAPALWVLSPAGLFRSTDLGAQWVRLPTGSAALPLSAIAVDPADPSHLLLATDPDLYEAGGPGVGVFQVSLPSGATQSSSGLTGGAVAALAFDPSSAGRLFAYQRQPLVGAPVANGLFVSTDKGTSFSATALQSLTVNLTSWFRTSPLNISPDGTLYVGVDDDASGLEQLWRSTDHGASYATDWSATNVDSDGGAIAPWLPTGVYGASSGRVYMTGRQQGTAMMASTDAGGSFVDAGAGLSMLGLLANGMALTPDGGIVLATAGGVFYAADGINFLDFNAGFASPPVVWRVVLVPGAQPTVFAVTDQGIFRRQLGP